MCVSVTWVDQVSVSAAKRWRQATGRVGVGVGCVRKLTQASCCSFPRVRARASVWCDGCFCVLARSWPGKMFHGGTQHRYRRSMLTWSGPGCADGCCDGPHWFLVEGACRFVGRPHAGHYPGLESSCLVDHWGFPGVERGDSVTERGNAIAGAVWLGPR